MDEIRDTFKEAKIDEPNWQTVCTKLGLELPGHVSASELFQAWLKRGPSWQKLFMALGLFPEYQQVANLAKKKAGLCATYSTFVVLWGLSLLHKGSLFKHYLDMSTYTERIRQYL